MLEGMGLEDDERASGIPVAHDLEEDFEAEALSTVCGAQAELLDVEDVVPGGCFWKEILDLRGEVEVFGEIEECVSEVADFLRGIEEIKQAGVVVDGFADLDFCEAGGAEGKFIVFSIVIDDVGCDFQ